MSELAARVCISDGDPYDIDCTRPNLWSNQFRIGRDGTRREVIEKFRYRVETTPYLLRDLPSLVGKRLGCVCRLNQPCHVAVIIAFLGHYQKQA